MSAGPLASQRSFVVVNIGNTTTQVARVQHDPGHAGLRLSGALDLRSHDTNMTQLTNWLEGVPAEQCWYVSSVYQAAFERLRAWHALHLKSAAIHRLTNQQFPLATAVREPGRVGSDRLAAAVAATHHKRSHAPACIVDAGTAITVDMVDAAGVFLGGAICPGIEIASAALHDYTDALPRVSLIDAGPPPPIGDDTETAIRSGIYWGAIGTVERIIQQSLESLPTADVDVFLTGGIATMLARHLARPVRVVPDLVLEGIAWAALHLPPDGYPASP